MSRLTALISTPRSVHWWISVALIFFGLAMMAALTIQSFNSQSLIEHKFWASLLRDTSAEHAKQLREHPNVALPDSGIVRSWYVDKSRGASQAPSYLVDHPPGLYSTEAGSFFTGVSTFTEDDSFDDQSSFHALIVDLPPGRLITVIDIAQLEDQQNQDAVVTVVWAAFLVLFIGGLIFWLHLNLVRPVRDLARRMQAIVPGAPGGRLPTSYQREEIQVIAQASNAHLERVEQFIERERSLLDQASHEFRTPIAVIAGAVDVLKQLSLPDASAPVLARIEHAVEDLSETMVALLYLAREPSNQAGTPEITALHDLLPRILADHEHLLGDKPARLRIGVIESAFIAAPEAMVRIAVSNLIRNAVESTEDGEVELSLEGFVISVTDSGSGFNPVEAARRYRDSLRQSVPIRGQGLGLFLIGRICDRFNWKLTIEQVAPGGTRAALDVRASAIEF
ncbi:HAMP domain-containing sensor histidine kinase [Pseudoxanthomonas sp. CF125]|uniref:HAMP domain-containing sensor histidine kinase n=1 Tax=Pseudoxanthomonas sp. CF125 TaxID=1855303 RepID=UPI0008831567|nr:HAMP domain-containing sensor histidine kinase [Pseudoxanthomonas sp. CF125]SDQ23399.1 Signal transduction histidine kinase [Pseudoxanthomonas sp. CF125]